MNQLTRLSIVLLGIFFAIRGIASIGSSSAHFLKYSELYGQPGWINSWLIHLAASSAVIFLTSIAPALVLIGLRHRIADRLFPDRSSAFTLTLSAAYILGCTLLSIFFMISGAAQFIGGIAQGVTVFFSESDIFRQSLLGAGSESLASGGVQLALGFFLYRHAATTPAA